MFILLFVLVMLLDYLTISVTSPYHCLEVPPPLRLKSQLIVPIVLSLSFFFDFPPSTRFVNAFGRAVLRLCKTFKNE